MHTKYRRSGGQTGAKELFMYFSTWGLFVADAQKQEIRALGPEFGEAIGELEKVAGLPGTPEFYAYSARAGLVAVSLYDNYPSPPQPTGLALIKVPEW